VPKTLTPKQKRFAEEYLVDLNATQAAIRAGYSEDSASIIGFENLRKPNIASAIRKRQNKLAEDIEVTQARVIAEYAKLGFSNMARFANLDDDLPRFDFSDLTPDEMAAVSEITVDTRRESGEEGGMIAKVRFKLHDKKGALDSLSRHLGLFEKDNTQTVILPPMQMQFAAPDLPLPRADEDGSEAD